MQLVPPEARAENPVLASGHEMAARWGRDTTLPPALAGWTAALFPDETQQQTLLREAACWMSDIGSQDHPEYRAVQSFLRVLRQPGVALDHHARAYLAFILALRYDAEPDQSFLDTARMLLDMSSLRRAEIMGMALRLAFTLSGGTAELLAGSSLLREPGRVRLRLAQGSGVFASEAITRRLERLAQSIGVEAVTEEVA
jgi:exopolyphosphatase/guanosine-5'-triphosphate,3'-diphosphate pyrophosphatase